MSLPALLLVGAVAYAARRLLRYLDDPEPASPPSDQVDTAAAAPAAPPTDDLATQPAAQADEAGQADREINRGLVTSAAGLSLALLGTFAYPLLIPFSSAVTLYSSLPLFRRASAALFVEQRLRVSILDALAVVTAQLGGFYIASAIGSLTYHAGCKLLLKTEDQSRRKLVTVFSTQQRTVWLLRDGIELETPLDDVQVGDLVVIHAGQTVPVDGFILEGSASLDQHLLTGEAQPDDKGEGERVLASTLVLSGRIVVQVEKTGAATVVAQIGQALNATAGYRTELEHRSERIGDASVLPLLTMSALALVTLGGESAVILLGCNFADNIRVAGPLGMLNFMNLAAQRSILLKDGRVLERLQEIDTVVFDKTGTLTLEQPVVGAVHTCGDIDAAALLGWAAMVERRQSHPLARAIIERAQQMTVPIPEPDDVRCEVGYGLAATIQGRRVQVGSARFMARVGVAIPPEIEALQTALHAQGSSLVYVSIDDRLGGALEIHPTVRSEMPQVLQALRERGMKLCIISGDHEAPTRRLAADLGIESYHAEVLPADKASLVLQLQEQGHRVCYIGDGLNDTIALKAATCSISLRGAATAATDTAQIILLGGDLGTLPALFTLSDEYRRNARYGDILSIGAGAVCAGSVFLLHIGLFSAIAIYNLSFVASIANAMLPMLRQRSSTAGSRSEQPATTAPPSGSRGEMRLLT